jgi:hypothetical protein
MPSRRSVFGAALVLATLAVSGCGPERGTVSGRVTYRCQPLAGATVLFYAEGQQVASCLVAADGTYRAADLAPGKARVAVVATPQVPPGLLRANRNAPKEARPHGAPDSFRVIGPSGRAVRIPARYSRPDDSGLSLLVVRGEQSWDIELQPEKSR